MLRESTTHGPPRSATDERAVTTDDVYRVLAHPVRRFVLADLTAQFHPVPVYDLASRYVTASSQSGANDATFRAAEERLTRDHLPRMAAAGLIQSTPTGFELTSTGIRVERLRRACGTYLRSDDSVLWD